MDIEDPMDRFKEFLGKLQAEEGKVKAAGCRLEARCKDLEAAVHVGDWEAVERARHAAVMAFENFLDARLTGFRHMKREAAKL